MTRRGLGERGGGKGGGRAEEGALRSYIAPYFALSGEREIRGHARDFLSGITGLSLSLSLSFLLFLSQSSKVRIT